MDKISELREAVWGHYARHGRSMPWRDDHTPYRVLVSELMLQQTGVARVAPKFDEFMRAFPAVDTLARAPLGDVLRVWQGLGYNRRARYLHEAAKTVVRDYGGRFPSETGELIKLPGVGRNTAEALRAYAFDLPAVFIETNIRTVLFHHFFNDASDVPDRDLLPLLEAVLPGESPREWYWALMDYGTHLKKTAGGRLETSRHYKKQSPLKGSVREVRGRIVAVLTAGPLTEAGLRDAIGADERYESARDGLIRDGLIVRQDGSLGLTGG